MFNLSGSELIFLVLIALVVLGPDKLPEAMRKAGKAYADFKKMTSGFQNEMRSVLDEPMRELRETAELAKKSAMWDVNAPSTTPTPAAPTATPKPATTPGQAPEQTIPPAAGPTFTSAAPRTPVPTAQIPAEVPDGAPESDADSDPALDAAAAAQAEADAAAARRAARSKPPEINVSTSALPEVSAAGPEPATVLDDHPRGHTVADDAVTSAADTDDEVASA